jgi:hypothetical protein
MKSDIQKAIFNLIKQRIAGTENIGNVLSEVLSISSDAVYRRYRGETPLTIHETQKICNHFNISFDNLLESGDGFVLFDYSPFKSFDIHLDSYLEGILESVQRISNLKDAKILMSVNNGHIFQLMNFPQLVRFRLFFWAKTHLQIKKYEQLKFKHEKVNPHSFDLGKKILSSYNKIPSTEILDFEFMRGFLRQILFYFQSHLFDDPNYALFLCERVQLFIAHLKEQAEKGQKFIFGTSHPAFGNDVEFFLNETNNNDSTIHYSSKEAEGIFIGHNVLNYIHTSDSTYVSDTNQSLQRELKNSSKISQENEKLRNQYFAELNRMAENFKTKIKSDLSLLD